MKKLLTKLINRVKTVFNGAAQRLLPGNKEVDSSSLPTNDTLEDHRREILRAGKKHSRPLSTTQRKVVLISTIISITLVLTVSTMYVRSVYYNISTSGLIGSVSRLIPTSVLQVEGENIYYDDVLFQYDTLKNVQADSNSFDSDAALTRAITKAIESKTIERIAARQGVTVTDQELDAGIAEPISLAGGDEAFESTIMDTYGWTRDDFRKEFRIQLLKSRLVTQDLHTFIDQVDSADFQTAAETAGLEVVSESLDDDNELLPEIADAATTLQEGEVSQLVYGEEGVFVVAKADADTLTHVYQSYEAVDEYINDEVSTAEITNCLSTDINVENTTNKSWFRCL